MRNAQDVIAAIHASLGNGDKHGLRNTEALLREIAPDRKVPVIHVAGTNGKGSVCAMVESILRHAGMRTGLYTSPFLQAYNERIRLDGVPVTDEALARYGNSLLDASERLALSGIHPAPFELGTALALSVFEGEGVDAAVIEVGLGGRLDPTNVVSPVVCAITAIGMDHMQYLGNTVEAIAGEKAGIIKPGVPVVAQKGVPSVEKVFAETAARQNAPLCSLRDDMILASSCGREGSVASFRLREDWPDVFIPLPGEHQVRNALTALAVAEELTRQGFPLARGDVYRGIAETRWPARLEWHDRILLDGAHNAQGVGCLSSYVQEHLRGERLVLLTGVLAEKLGDDMLRLLASIAPRAVTVTPDNPRALSGEELARRLTAAGCQAESAPSLASGLARARSLAGSGGIIVAAGSLYLMGALRTELGLPWR